MGTRIPTTLAEIDDALAECSKRLRLAKRDDNLEAQIVYRKQADRLLTWRKRLTDGGNNWPLNPADYDEPVRR